MLLTDLTCMILLLLNLLAWCGTDCHFVCVLVVVDAFVLYLVLLVWWCCLVCFRFVFGGWWVCMLLVLFICYCGFVAPLLIWLDWSINGCVSCWFSRYWLAIYFVFGWYWICCFCYGFDGLCIVVSLFCGDCFDFAFVVGCWFSCRFYVICLLRLSVWFFVVLVFWVCLGFDG